MNLHPPFTDLGPFLGPHEAPEHSTLRDTHTHPFPTVRGVPPLRPLPRAERRKRFPGAHRDGVL